MKDKKIEVVASSFCLMELSDTKKEDLFFTKIFIKQKKTINDFISLRRSIDLSNEELEENSEFIQDTMSKLKFVEWLKLKEDASDLLLDVSKTTNISAPDSIHFVTAVLSDCTHLITEDTHLMKHANRLLEEADKDEKAPVKLKVLGVEQAIKDVFT